MRPRRADIKHCVQPLRLWQQGVGPTGWTAPTSVALLAAAHVATLGLALLAAYGSPWQVFHIPHISASWGAHCIVSLTLYVLL